MTNMEICHLVDWEKFILDYARSESCEGSKIRIPFSMAKEMRLASESECDIVEVDEPKFRKCIFEQGHVSNLIVLYAISGKEYDKVRLDLTMCLIDYVVDNIPQFSDWEGTGWVDELYSGKGVSLKSLLPLIVKWIRYDYTNDDYKKFQYILPLYLFLGDYKQIPETRRELRMCMYDIVAGTNFVGDPTWQDVYYDISRSGKVFRAMVKYADSLFHEEVVESKNTSFIKKLIDKPKTTSEQTIQRVGNWLAFCAYITLLSKYQRYSLNADGFRDARLFVAKEAAQMFLKIRDKIG